MAQESTPSAGASATDPPHRARLSKSRFGIGRIITWFVILGLLALLFFEWRARAGYTGTLEAITQRINGNQLVRLNEVDAVVSGNPSVTRHERPQGDVVEYEWWSLFRDYRAKLQLGSQEKNAVVLGVLTADDDIDAPGSPPPSGAGRASDMSGSPPSGMAPRGGDPQGMARGEGPGNAARSASAGASGSAEKVQTSNAGGQAEPVDPVESLMARDNDNSGKLTPNELPPFAGAAFMQFDADEDGALDRSEAAKAVSKMLRGEPREATSGGAGFDGAPETE